MFHFVSGVFISVNTCLIYVNDCTSLSNAYLSHAGHKVSISHDNQNFNNMQIPMNILGCTIYADMLTNASI